MSLDIEAQRLQNLQHKQRLLEELNLHPHGTKQAKPEPDAKPPLKKRQLNPQSPIARTRTSARLAATATRISYQENTDDKDDGRRRSTKSKSKPGSKAPSSSFPPLQESPSPPPSTASTDLPTLLTRYNSWTPSASEPTQSPDGTYHFPSHPTFTPNKSPLSILLEGAFGGSFFSPWYSRTLHLSLENDYTHTLPPSWLSQLDPPTKYLVSPGYDAALNKYAVSCGQTLTEWEAAGWINFTHDPRGWFEWYIRFFLGRRLDDGEDERQVGRWSRCVGPKGRWKRMLLKRYVQAGVRSIYDDDDDDDDVDGAEREVSPVMHQTCHHWAYQVTQEDLDDAWREYGGGGGGGGGQ
ncbi:hypothetical protein RBB50_008701 [Rhinocladiella similis]